MAFHYLTWRKCFSELRGAKLFTTLDLQSAYHQVPLELRGAKLFTTLDLQSAYHQVPLNEDSRSLTTFITHDGLFRFKRVPYGLASGPSFFQWMMSTILKGLSGIQCYLEDIIVSGATPEEYDERLTVMLQLIENARLKLNLSKCNFRQTTVFPGAYSLRKGNPT
ncbi:hypothetical protein LDENG_00162960 [Lucifuga dentata]|nr:hypothetical protein LDENG_00162960 [Lucifuga dentata]